MAIALGRAYGDFHLKCTTVLFGSSVGKLSKDKNAYAFQLTLPPSDTPGCHAGDGLVFVMEMI